MNKINGIFISHTLLLGRFPQGIKGSHSSKNILNIFVVNYIIAIIQSIRFVDCVQPDGVDSKAFKVAYLVLHT